MVSTAASPRMSPEAFAASAKKERTVLARYRAEAPRLQELDGRGVQAWLQEQWAELHAWSAQLAITLEGSTARVESVTAERAEIQERVAELEGEKGFLEHLCSQRNVSQLEERAAVLQNHVDSFEAVRSELSAARNDVDARDQIIRELRSAVAARDAAVVEVEGRLAAEERETERRGASLTAERAERVAAEEAAQRARDETAQAHAQTARVRQEVDVATAHAEIDVAAAHAEVQQIRARMDARATEAAAARATMLAELASAGELLRVETAARVVAEAREARMREQLDMALRALQAASPPPCVLIEKETP